MVAVVLEEVMEAEVVEVKVTWGVLEATVEVIFNRDLEVVMVRIRDSEEEWEWAEDMAKDTDLEVQWEVLPGLAEVEALEAEVP